MASKFKRKTLAELHASRTDRCLTALDEALNRCREEDVRYGTGVPAALSFLERQADETWPFDQFRQALEDFSTEPVKAEARHQVLDASLSGIKRAIGR